MMSKGVAAAGQALDALPPFTATDEVKTRFAYRLYLLYIVSFFLHSPARLHFLGTIHVDMIMVGVIFFLTTSSGNTARRQDRASRILLIMLAYSIFEIPIVTWPGSVVHYGLSMFIKAIIFYFFTVKLIRTEKRLVGLILTFVLCNAFRVFEPLYMHLTTGYWGDMTDMGGVIEHRLQGSPYDIVNANGLAFVIASILPFFHYIFGGGGWKGKLFYIISLPLLLFAMKLTLSRSGLLAVAIVGLSIFVKSKRKGLLGLIGVAVVAIFFSTLNSVQSDRYLSIVDHHVAGGKSAEGRITGLIADFKVAMERPIFGHGMGTSKEANFHGHGNAQPSHNLWIETWQEIGLIGLIMLAAYVVTIVKNFSVASRALRQVVPPKDMIYRCSLAMQVWMYMNLLFSLASFGLTDYEWYLFGGLSVVIADLARRRLETSGSTPEESQSREVMADSKLGLAPFSRGNGTTRLGIDRGRNNKGTDTLRLTKR